MSAAEFCIDDDETDGPVRHHGKGNEEKETREETSLTDGVWET